MQFIILKLSVDGWDSEEDGDSCGLGDSGDPALGVPGSTDDPGDSNGPDSPTSSSRNESG